MPLVSLHNLNLAFGAEALLDGVDLAIEQGERICLVGRNGSGKTSLIRVLAGTLAPDDGEMLRDPATRFAHLEQEVPTGLRGTVFEVVAEGLGELGELVTQYHEVSAGLASAADTALLARLSEIQQRLEAANAWQSEQRVEAVISRLSLPADDDFSALSGGTKRRVLLARALVGDPDLLLLDEPTNHLDIATIEWLEAFLQGFRGAVLFVTHDRAFLQRLATRILELDRGQITDWPGDYANFLRRKEALLKAESHANQRTDQRLASEEIWVRQGIKARRTRNEGRVRALEALREQRRQRRERLGAARLEIQQAEQSGRLVVEARQVGFSWDGVAVVRDFSTVILRGDRVGVIGPNGVGKSTLLNLLLGRLSPQAGSVRLGSRLEVAYFDQMRAALDPEKSIRDNLGTGSEQIVVNGRPRHLVSYLKDFLFTPERTLQPVGALSGGERNRLLLARLFALPANLLVLDEPTNDLDMETLELLEERLLAFSGTLLLVSHDREFLNNLVTSCLVFEGQGRVAEYVGGYDDWLRQHAPAAPAARAVSPRGAAPRPVAAKPKRRPGKLSYNDQRELESLPQRIEALEGELAALEAELSDPAFYRQAGDLIAVGRERLQSLQQRLELAYGRWEQLEAGVDDAGVRERTR